MKKLILLIMISSLFGDKMRYMHNGMVLIKEDIKYLGVKNGYIYFSETRAFGKQKTSQINCQEVYSITINNSLMKTQEIDCSINTFGVSGCIDKGACNYNSLAGEDDGTCQYPEENFNCSGECVMLDCTGACGGNATIDCAGVCGGGAVKDICGVCGGEEVIITNCLISQLDNDNKMMLYKNQKKDPSLSVIYELLLPTYGYTYSENWLSGLFHRGSAIALMFVGKNMLMHAEDEDAKISSAFLDHEIKLQIDFANILQYTGVIYWVWGYLDVAIKTRQYNNEFYKTIFGDELSSFNFKLQPSFHGAYLTFNYSFR